MVWLSNNFRFFDENCRRSWPEMVVCELYLKSKNAVYRN